MTFLPATALPTPKQSTQQGTTGKLSTTGVDDSAYARHRPASLEISRPFSTDQPRRLPDMFEGGQPSNARLWHGLIQRCCSRRRTHLGWVVRDVSSHELTRLPSVLSIFMRRCDRGIRSSSCHARRRSTMSSDAVGNFSCCPDASCTVALFIRRGVPLRDHGLPRPNARRRCVPPSFLRLASTPGFNVPFAGLFPPTGGAEHFCSSGPTCRFDAPRPGPINFRRA